MTPYNPWGGGGQSQQQYPEYPRNYALNQNNMYGNPYGRPSQQSSGWGSFGSGISYSQMPGAERKTHPWMSGPYDPDDPSYRNRRPQQPPTPSYGLEGRPGPPPDMQAPNRWQQQGLGMFDSRVTNPLLRNDMSRQGLTEQGQAAQQLAQSQNQQRQDQWTQAMQQQNAMSRANLATTGLDTGEHERLQRDVRREGILGQQEIGRDFDDRMLQLKMQDEAIKRENTAKLMGLSASAAQMEVPWSRQDDIWAGATANENQMARWRHEYQGWADEQARKRDAEWMRNHWANLDKNREIERQRMLNAQRQNALNSRNTALEADRQRRHELELDRRTRDHDAWLRRNFPQQFGATA